jgi:hypothetical protein
VIVARASGQIAAVEHLFEAREGEVFATHGEKAVTYDLGTPGYRIPPIEESR